MARVSKPLAVRADAPGVPLSIDDPTKYAYNNYLSNVLGGTGPGGTGFSDLQQQLRGEGLSVSGIGGQGGPSVPVSVSDQPNISPFPLGCPPNFYQSGNVCIPVVGAFPGSVPGDTGGNLGGYDVPKGVIQQIVLLDDTGRELVNPEQNKAFYVQVFYKNAGGVAAKFSIHIALPSINIDTQSNSSWVPEFSNAVLYKRIIMPANAPIGQEIQGTVSLEHMNTGVAQGGTTVNGSNIVDDSQTLNIPAPIAGGGGGGPPPPQQCSPGTRYSQCFQSCRPAGELEPAPGSPQCVGGTPNPPPSPQTFTITLIQLAQYARNYPQIVQIQNPQYLVGLVVNQGYDPNTASVTFTLSTSHSASDGCITVNGQIYCPTAVTGTNINTQAAIVLTPASSVQSGHPISVAGTGFQPGEAVQIVLTMTLHSTNNQYNGKQLYSSAYPYADSNGAFTASVQTPAFPSTGGVTAPSSKMEAQGIRSGKRAIATISIT